MNKFIKITACLICIALISGCFGNLGPSERVEDMLNKYIKNDQDIIDELDTYIDKQDLNNEQKERYKDIIKDEYSSIKYEIKDEIINGEGATVEVSIEVKDLYKVTNETENYLIENPTEFYTEGIYDADKFIDYKLDKMEESKETVNYMIYVNLINKDDNWVIESLDDDTLEKIHGIYNYEANQE